MLVELDVFAWVLAPFLPFFGGVCSFVDSRVESCRLWAAVSCYFLQLRRRKHHTGIQKHVEIVVCALKSKLKPISASCIHIFRSVSAF